MTRYKSINKYIYLGLVIILIGLSYRNNRDIELLMNNANKKNVEKVGSYIADNIADKLEGEFIELEVLSQIWHSSERIEGVYENELRKIIKDTKNMEYIDLVGVDGILQDSQGKIYNLLDTPYFQEALKGNIGVSEPIESGLEEEVIVIAFPIIEKNEAQSVLVSIYKATYFLEKTIMDLFAGEGRVYIVDEDKNILFSLNKGSQKEYEYEIGKVPKGLEEYYQEDKYFYIYKEVPKSNGWYVGGTIPKGMILGSLKKVLIRDQILLVGSIVLFVALVICIYIKEKKFKQHTYELAYIDSKTKLYNRNKFMECGQERISANTNIKQVLIYLDIDGFSGMKEIFGEIFGDRLIKAIAEEIKLLFSKDRGALYAYLGDDYFAVMLDYNSEKDLIERLNRLDEQIQAIRISGYPEIHIITSTGVYVVQEDTKDIQRALSKASMARMEIKGLHHRSYKIFDEKLGVQVRQHTLIETDMVHALRKGQLQVLYQPKVRLEDKKIIGAEALIRWHHPTQGTISPAVFIPIAEKNGSILDFTKYVITQVCKDLNKWNGEGKKLQTVSINFSSMEIYDPCILKYLQENLEKYNINPRWIEIEVTERVAIEDMRIAKETIEQFQKIGIKVSMDDFGTGYTFVKNILNIPFDTIKIDKSLVDGIEKDLKARHLLAGIVNTIKSLGCNIIAEGVENEEQIRCLIQIGVEYAQGYVFDKPLPEDVFSTRLEDRRNIEFLNDATNIMSEC